MEEWTVIEQGLLDSLLAKKKLVEQQEKRKLYLDAARKIVHYLENAPQTAFTKFFTDITIETKGAHDASRPESFEFNFKTSDFSFFQQERQYGSFWRQ